MSLRTGIFYDPPPVPEAPLPNEGQEHRTVTHCDGDKCEAFWVAVSDLGPAIAPQSWLSKDGKDYCGYHAKPFRDAEFEQLKERLASGDLSSPVSDDSPSDGGALDLDSELDSAELQAGLGRRTPPPPVRGRQELSAGWGVFIGVLMVTVAALGLLAQHWYLRADAAEAQVTSQTISDFEQRAQISRIDCDGFLSSHRTCSGRLGVDGQSQVKPVRYRCDKDKCVFECGDK